MLFNKITFLIFWIIWVLLLIYGAIESFCPWSTPRWELNTSLSLVWTWISLLSISWAIEWEFELKKEFQELKRSIDQIKSVPKDNKQNSKKPKQWSSKNKLIKKGSSFLNRKKQ